MFLPALFSLTLLTSAFLLFLVQPMFARMVLPLLGGSAAVWTTCMLFFQAALLLGYGYSHGVTRNLAPRKQALLHLCLLCVALICLPVAVPSGYVPDPSTPVRSLLVLLLRAVGLPFLLLSTSAPLLMRWFSLSGHKSAKDPYFLYSASNVGSVLALVLYPLFVERYLTLSQQGLLFAVGYGLLILLIGAAAAQSLRGHLVTRAEVEMPAEDAASADPGARSAPQPLSLLRKLRWIALAALPSSLMLGATTHLTTDVAPVPLLWVLPLLLYLLTFVIAFAKRPLLPHGLMRKAFPFLLTGAVFLQLSQLSKPVWLVVALHCTFVFVAALFCHGELAEDRPSADHLTEFYLYLSVGGALGGLFNSIVAPLCFKSTTEYAATIALTGLVLPGILRGGVRRRLFELGFALVLGGLYFYIRQRMSTSGWPAERSDRQILSSILTVILLVQLRRPLGYMLAAGALFVAYDTWLDHGETFHYRGRTFYGTFEVTEADDDDGATYKVLLHGTTKHGAQYVQKEWRTTPITYYCPGSPIDDIFNNAWKVEGATKPSRIAVAGLGTGGLAAMVGQGQSLTFYEIDPMAEDVAERSGSFTYLADARGRGANVNVVIGDGRLALSAAQGGYDLIVMDAFSSDAVPVHLLTKEALQLYLQKLSPTGVIALHITNRNLRLLPVVSDLAHELGLVGRARYEAEEDDRDNERKAAQLSGVCWNSHFVVLGRKEADLKGLLTFPRWHPLLPRSNARIWTDDYSNILGVLKH